MYKNQFLERKTKAIADTYSNQIITSIDVLLALYSNDDIVAHILKNNKFTEGAATAFYLTNFDENYKGKYIVSDFAKILFNTKNNEEAINTIINNDCTARMALSKVGNLIYILKDFFKARGYYDTSGAYHEGTKIDCRKDNLSEEIAHKVVAPKKSKIVEIKAEYPQYSGEVKNNYNNFNANKVEKALYSNIMGQEEPIKTVLASLMRGFCGLTSDNTPRSKFLFCGPTGVGKTQLAKVLCQELGYNIIKIDMSEYQEKVSLTKLIGAAPGYAGYEDGGQLTSAIEKNPKSVIIFDEIEKAHQDIFSVFLQILDEGRLTDNKGNTFNFNESIIIFTSNVGASHKSDYVDLTNDKYMKAVNETFKPEFINRLDEIVVFNKLDQQSLKGIVAKELNLLKERLSSKKNIIMSYDDEFTKWFIQSNIDLINFNYGAREIYRLVQKQISSPIAAGMCDNMINEGNRIQLISSEKIYKVF